MNRPAPPAPGALRDQTRETVERLGVLGDRWLDGTPPAPDALDAIAEDLARLRAGIVTGGYLAQCGSSTRPRPTSAR